MFARADRSHLADWWWTVDKVLLGTLLGLLFSGLVLSLAASPPVAERLNLDSFHFVKRHAQFLVPAIAVLIGASLMTPRQMRRTAMIVFAIGLFLMALTLVSGAEVKGARRWLSIGFTTIQPSEFVKPAFVVLAAWLFAERARRPDMPALLLCFVLLLSFIGLLILQPDFGQTMLAVLVWGALFFTAGVPWMWIIALGIASIVGIVAAYMLVPHVQGRIDRFIDPASGDTYQVSTAMESFVRGSWLGRGPGEGTVKHSLPDSHTDFIFAVMGEEFGIVLCLALVLVFGFIVLRGLGWALREEDPFRRLCVASLVILFGLQSAINMAVNLNLMPAKGMTLPFVSYGGSSLISLAYAMGMVLGLMRRRPQAGPRVVRHPGMQVGTTAG